MSNMCSILTTPNSTFRKFFNITESSKSCEHHLSINFFGLKKDAVSHFRKVHSVKFSVIHKK